MVVTLPTHLYHIYHKFVNPHLVTLDFAGAVDGIWLREIEGGSHPPRQCTCAVALCGACTARQAAGAWPLREMAGVAKKGGRRLGRDAGIGRRQGSWEARRGVSVFYRHARRRIHPKW
jgi:hypothetical protein